MKSPTLKFLAGANVAEGVVIRPAAGGGAASRGLFKLKIPEFSEKIYQNNGWKAGKRGGCGHFAGTWSAEALLELELLAAATEQRVHSVLSKTGRVARVPQR